MKRLRTAAVAPKRCWASTPATPREARWKTAMMYAATPSAHTSQARRDGFTPSKLGARLRLRRGARFVDGVDEGVPVHRERCLGALGDDRGGHGCTVPRSHARVVRHKDGSGVVLRDETVV